MGRICLTLTKFKIIGSERVKGKYCNMRTIDNLEKFPLQYTSYQYKQIETSIFS